MSTWMGVTALGALLAAASATDLRARRIPNALVAMGGLAGLGLQALLPAGRGLFDTTTPGSIGLVAALCTAAVLLCAGMLLWRLRLLGAGDAKLLAAVGAYVGPAGVVPVLAGTFVAGGALALAALAWRAFRAAGRHAARSTRRLPYALAIAAGATFHAAPGVLSLASSNPAGAACPQLGDVQCAVDPTVSFLTPPSAFQP